MGKTVFVLDVEPPTIECLTPQIFYADKGLSTASSVIWEEPKVYDTVDENPVVVQTEGPHQYTTLTEERTYVSYVATDESGNESPECSIELRVERKHNLQTHHIYFNKERIYDDISTLRSLISIVQSQ